MEHVPFEASLRLYNRANWDTQKSTLHYPLCPASQSMRHLKVHHSQRQTNRSRSTRQAMVHQKAKYNDKSLTFHSNALLSSSSENPRLLEEAHHSRLPTVSTTCFRTASAQQVSHKVCASPCFFAVSFSRKTREEVNRIFQWLHRCLEIAHVRWPHLRCNLFQTHIPNATEL